jgi:hypothetical protein
MTGLPPAAVRQLSLPEVAAYAEAIDAEATAQRLALMRARQGRRSRG